MRNNHSNEQQHNEASAAIDTDSKETQAIQQQAAPVPPNSYGQLWFANLGEVNWLTSQSTILQSYV